MDKVVLFLKSLGVENIERHPDHLVCPTICHNPIDEAESMKLYYYDKTKNFHCYTECSENFNIIVLYQKYMAINHQEVSYDEALYYIRQFIDVEENEVQPTEIISWKDDFETQKQSIITLPEVDKNALDYFIPYSHPLWEMEGIPSSIQGLFNIRFSYGTNRIIIPHYDIDGRLIGIRVRAIDEEDMVYGKYRPAQIGERMFNHQLGFNLYGIWEHKEAIRKTKRVVVYEGEVRPFLLFL